MYNYIHANILLKKDGSKIYIKKTKPKTDKKTYAKVSKRNIRYMEEITALTGNKGIYEVDTIFACRGSKKKIVTLVHRATNYRYACVINDRKAETVSEAIDNMVINDIGKEISLPFYQIMEVNLLCGKIRTTTKLYKSN